MIASPILQISDIPAHDCHVTHGALFETFGDWSRPAAYPRSGETLLDLPGILKLSAELGTVCAGCG